MLHVNSGKYLIFAPFFLFKNQSFGDLSCCCFNIRFVNCYRFLHPLYFGDYPKSMRERLGDQLPEFTEEDQELLSSFMDFVGLNQYTSRLVSHAAESAEEGHFHKAQQIEKIGNDHH